MAESAKWYVVHTYSGYENKVAATIQKTVENRSLQDIILDIRVPLETVTEIRDNGPKEVERKMFPGYVLIKMVMTDEGWYVVRNTRGVTKPVPLTDEEVASMGVEKLAETKLSYQVGDSVKVTDGPLDGFIGKVDEIDVATKTVKVTVSMFGRETPVELQFGQVAALEQ